MGREGQVGAAGATMPPTVAVDGGVSDGSITILFHRWRVEGDGGGSVGEAARVK